MSKFNYVLNSEFENCKEFIIDIKKFFNDSENTIHKARNEIKVIKYQNKDLVVKSFKVPNFLNSILYSFFKKSKARKSYEYALRIKDFTTKAIGYIEFYENFLLKDSYFISENFAYDFTIREVLLKEDFTDKANVFKAFAKFTYDLHEKGIYHLDYSPGNILIKKEKDAYSFKIVDINRMKFLNFNLDLRMKNFSKLWAKDEDLILIVKEYAKLSKEDEENLVNKALFFSKKHKKFKNFKKKLKGQEFVD